MSKILYQSELHLLHVLTNSKTEVEDIASTSQSTEGPYHEAARQLHQSVPAEAHLWCKRITLSRFGNSALSSEGSINAGGKVNECWSQN